MGGDMEAVRIWLNRLSVSVLVALGLSVVIDAYKPRTDAAAGAAYAGQSESFSPAPKPEPEPQPEPDGEADESDEQDDQAGQESEEESGPSDAEEADESVPSPTYFHRYRRVGPLRRLFGRGGW